MLNLKKTDNIKLKKLIIINVSCEKLLYIYKCINYNFIWFIFVINIDITICNINIWKKNSCLKDILGVLYIKLLNNLLNLIKLIILLLNY